MKTLGFKIVNIMTDKGLRKFPSSISHEIALKSLNHKAFYKSLNRV